MKDRQKHHKKSRRSGNPFYALICIALGIVLVLLVVYNSFQISSLGTAIEQKADEAKEAARPAEIQLATIQDPNCDDCFDIMTVVDSIKEGNVNVTKEQNLLLASEKAEILIERYGIERVPAAILFGDINKINAQGMEKRGNALVFTQVTPPYTEAGSGRITGKVSATLIRDSSCAECIDLNPILAGMRQSGIMIADENVVERSSQEGIGLISRYAINALPALILSGDLGAYDSDITNAWEQVGTVEEDGSYIVRKIGPPYLDLAANEVVGLIAMTVLADDSCGECYDAGSFHKSILRRMGIAFSGEKTVDISSGLGESLVDKYSIEKVPTIILEGDMEEYPVLAEAWPDVGTVESDGAYVFRKVEITQEPYKDLSAGTVIG